MELTKEFQDLGLVQKPKDILISSGKIGMICAIQASNREVLIDAINQYVDSSFFKGQSDANYLHVELSGEQLGCSGSSMDYKTEFDIPEHSVPCTCGNPKHWLIKYEKENE